MAHERLSPRQKMIGMMYLILTAMLALNVSKEAVEAFKKVDKSLTTTLANYIKKNNLIYEEFTRAAAENPTKAGKYKNTAYEVKARADEVVSYIQDLKKEIIYEAEGPDTPAIQGDEVIIEEVKKIDENNVPSQILIGANENGKAFTLKALINDYREFHLNTRREEHHCRRGSPHKPEYRRRPRSRRTTDEMGEHDISHIAPCSSGYNSLEDTGRCQEC